MKIDYARDVRPILMEKCYVCHGPVQQLGGLRLDSKQDRLSNALERMNDQFLRAFYPGDTVQMSAYRQFGVHWLRNDIHQKLKSAVASHEDWLGAARPCDDYVPVSKGLA